MYSFCFVWNSVYIYLYIRSCANLIKVEWTYASIFIYTLTCAATANTSVMWVKTHRYNNKTKTTIVKATTIIWLCSLPNTFLRYFKMFITSSPPPPPTPPSPSSSLQYIFPHLCLDFLASQRHCCFAFIICTLLALTLLHRLATRCCWPVLF